MNFQDPVPKPTLTEPGVKYFLNQALKQSHIIRENFNNMILINFQILIIYLICSFKDNNKDNNKVLKKLL